MKVYKKEHKKLLEDYYKSNKNTLKSEGEYLNGKRWYVIVYNYEGKRIHSIVNGDGYFNEYNKEGKLIYEGEYKNGEKNGKGKEYYDNGKLLYEGEYKNEEIKKRKRIGRKTNPGRKS